MNTLAQWAPTLVSLLLAVFVYGRLTEAVKGNTTAITTLQASDRRQWEKLDKHGERIAKVETACRVRHGEGQPANA